MATIRIEAQVSADQIFQARQQLPPPELERLLARAQSKLPPEIWAEYSRLRDILRGGKLNPAEHARMLELVQFTESHNVERIRALAELARLRRQSLKEVMDDLGIKPPEYE